MLSSSDVLPRHSILCVKSFFSSPTSKLRNPVVNLPIKSSDFFLFLISSSCLKIAGRSISVWSHLRNIYIVMLMTTLCWWLYDGDSFQIERVITDLSKQSQAEWSPLKCDNIASTLWIQSNGRFDCFDSSIWWNAKIVCWTKIVRYNLFLFPRPRIFPLQPASLTEITEFRFLKKL